MTAVAASLWALGALLMWRHLSVVRLLSVANRSAMSVVWPVIVCIWIFDGEINE